LYGLTINQQTANYTSNEAAIRTNVTPFPSNLRFAYCRIEHTEYGFYISGDSFVITHCTIAYTGLMNSTRRAIGITGTTGNSFVTKNTWVNNAATGSLRAVGMINATTITGNLVLQGNVQDPASTLQQFFNQEGVFGSGTSVFSLWVDGNDTNETSAFVVMAYATANVGNAYDKIVLTNNSCSNNHGAGGKGIIAFDNTGGSGAAFRSIGSLPVYASKNVVRNNTWRVDYVLATGSSGNIVGRITTVPDASLNIRSFYGDSLAVVSDVTLSPGSLTPGSYALGFYASIAEGDARLRYKFGYTNTYGYGSAFNVVQTGEFDVRSTTATLVNAFLLIPYATFAAATNRLRLEITADNVSGSSPVVIYSRDITNGSVTMAYKLVGYAL
jgi:hypothetical protein